jgi:kynureninase
LASVELFDEIGMDALIEKRDKITSHELSPSSDKEVDSTFEIITPTALSERGCQLSVLHGEDAVYLTI